MATGSAPDGAALLRGVDHLQRAPFFFLSPLPFFFVTYLRGSERELVRGWGGKRGRGKGEGALPVHRSDHLLPPGSALGGSWSWKVGTLM